MGAQNSYKVMWSMIYNILKICQQKNAKLLLRLVLFKQFEFINNIKCS